MKYLIVNSDDFGISEGVNRGILEAHHNGIVTSTTTMVNMPTAEAAIQEAQHSAPELGIGLHFTLSFGAPLSPPASVPSLVTGAGRFVSTFADLMAKLPIFQADDLERELTAQFERFCQIAGQLPTHLDSHHGSTYYHPVAFDIMLRLAQQYHLPIRWVEDAHEDDDIAPSTDDLRQKLAASIQQRGMPPHPEHFANFIFDFEHTPRVERLCSGLRTLQDGYTELMVHVGYGAGLEEDYNTQRDLELAAVTDTQVKRIIEQEGIKLVNFRAFAQRD